MKEVTMKWQETLPFFNPTMKKVPLLTVVSQREALSNACLACFFDKLMQNET